MSKIPTKCISSITVSQIVLEEQRSKMTFSNKARRGYKKIKIDGCVFSAIDGKKCDWLLQSCQYGDQYFVELKGSDYKEAERQIAATIDRLPKTTEDAKRSAFVILANRGPKIDTWRQMTEKKYKDKGIKIYFKESGYEHILDR